MSEWVSYREAAAMLGCHVSNVPKLVYRNELTTTGVRGASFSRSQVEALVDRRAQEREARAIRTPSKYHRVEHRPDQEHDWLSPKQVASLLGFTSQGVRQKIHRGKLPAVEHGGRLWVRRDLLEMVEAASLAKKTRRL